MSDLMLLGVLRMPLEMVQSDPATLIQFVARAHAAAERIEADAKLIEQLRAQLHTGNVTPTICTHASTASATASEILASHKDAAFELHANSPIGKNLTRRDNWSDHPEMPESREQIAQSAFSAGMHAAAAVLAASLGGVLQPLESAPKNRPILAYCNHEADPYTVHPDGKRLTLYAAHYEGLSHAPTGFHIIEWGGAFDDSTPEYSGASLPDWWFVAGSSFEVAANPILWTDLPPIPGDPGGAGSQRAIFDILPKTADQLYEEIERVLLHYKLDNWRDQHDSPLGLVDRLCDHDARDIGSGMHQIRLIVDAIYNEVLTTPPALATTHQGTP